MSSGDMAFAWPELAASPGAPHPCVPGARQGLRNVAAFRDNPLRLFADVARRSEGPLGLFGLGVRQGALALTKDAAAAVLTHPDLDKELRPYGFAGTFRGFSVLSDITGETLPYLDNGRAPARRRWVTPAYPSAQRRVAMMWDGDNDGARFDTLLAEHRETDGTADLYRAIGRFIFERFCGIFFGASYAEWASEITATLDDANMCLHALCSRWMPAPLLAQTPTAARLRAARKHITAFADVIMNDLYERSRNGEPVAAFALCDFEQLDECEVRDEVVTQLIVGTESTSLAASWTALMLMQNPTWWRRAHLACTDVPADELRRAGMNGNNDLSRCLREGLRMFPSFWQYLRVAQRDTEVAGVAVPKGTIHFVSPYLLQRDPRHYDQPDAFVPDRPADQGALFTFGFGARSCLGGRLAQSLIADVLRALLVDRPEPLVPLAGPPLDGIRPLIFGLKRDGGFRVHASLKEPGKNASHSPTHKHPSHPTHTGALTGTRDTR